jgi:hypothetical protein
MITAEHDGRKVRAQVIEPSSSEKLRFLTEAPNSLINCMKTQNMNSMDDEDIDYLTDAVSRYTDLSDREIDALSPQLLINLAGEVLQVLADVDTDGASEKRVRLVRLTGQALERIFTEKISVVGGMPDDATVHRINYNASDDTLDIVFESSEWEVVAEGDDMPVHAVQIVGFGDNMIVSNATETEY